MTLKKLTPALLIFPVLLPLTSTRATGQNVSNADIATVRAKLNMAVPYFNRAWSKILAVHGLRFEPPQVFPYLGSINTACGPLKPGNSYYCSSDKRVYLDLALLANLMEQTAAYMHTDGDYAAIVVAAHEMGHAVDHQLSSSHIGSFDVEQTADCFAGVVTNEARNDNRLDPGDLAEGRYALSLAGDYHSILISELHPGAHGSSAERVLAFNRGYYAGPAACTPKLGVAAPLPSGRILFHESFNASATAGPTGSACSEKFVTGGMLLEDIARDDASCDLQLGHFGAIPDHVRIEATFQIQKGNAQSPVGILFGAPASGPDSYYVAFVNANGGLGLMKGKPTPARMLDPTSLSDVMDPSSLSFTPASNKGYSVPNRITVDIHRVGAEAAVLLYINDKFIGLGMPQFSWGSANRNEQVGAYVGMPGTQAVFSNFQVVALPKDP